MSFALLDPPVRNKSGGIRRDFQDETRKMLIFCTSVAILQLSPLIWQQKRVSAFPAAFLEIPSNFGGFSQRVFRGCCSMFPGAPLLISTLRAKDLERVSKERHVRCQMVLRLVFRVACCSLPSRKHSGTFRNGSGILREQQQNLLGRENVCRRRKDRRSTDLRGVLTKRFSRTPGCVDS